MSTENDAFVMSCRTIPPTIKMNIKNLCFFPTIIKDLSQWIILKASIHITPEYLTISGVSDQVFTVKFNFHD